MLNTNNESNGTVPPQPDSGFSILLTLVVTLIGILLIRAVMPTLVEEVYYSMERGRQRAQYDIATEHLQDDPISELSTASQLVSRRIQPSLVHIDTRREEIAVKRRHTDEKFALVSREEREIREQGSGVVMSQEGEILTNYHVIKNAEQIKVTLSDNRIVEARVIGVDRLEDLALLKVDNVEGLVPAVFGDSDKLKEGALVWAAGSPFGLTKTITFGILSATPRDHGEYEHLLQSDVAVSPGNSGGPLVDAQGNVIGINTAIVGDSFQGISLSIPSNRVRMIYETVLSQGPKATRGWLGIRFSDLPPGQGALVGGLVDSHSPAAQAGIRPGDIITQWNGNVVPSNAAFARLVQQTEADSVAQVTLKRGEAELTVDVTVGPKPLQFH